MRMKHTSQLADRTLCGMSSMNIKADGLIALMSSTVTQSLTRRRRLRRLALLFDLAGRTRCTFSMAVDSMLLARRSIRAAQCCGLVELTLKRRRQPLRVVRVNVEAFAHTGSGHVGESFIHEGGRLPALGVNDDPVSRGTLR